MERGIYKRTERTRRNMSAAATGNKHGFQVGHRDFVSAESRKKAGEKISKVKKGVPLTVSVWHKGLKLPQRSGANHPRWIADRTQLSRYKNGNEYRNSPMHREWSGQVKNRDGWKCRIASDKCEGKVVAHHILSWREYPELRYNVNNGITLCQSHHPIKRDDEKRMSPYFQELVENAAH